MTELLLKPFYHQGQDRLGLFFDHNADLQAAVKRMPAARWSQTHKCWHLPLSADVYTAIKKALQHKANITATPPTEYLHKKKQVMNTFAKPVAIKSTVRLPAQTTAWQLSPGNLHALQTFVQQLKLKAYSPSTIKTYRNEFLQLLQLLKTRSVQDLTPDDLKRYMVHIMEKDGMSENTAHSRLNALKFYYEQVLGKEKFFWAIPRPKKSMRLPNVLSETELGKMFASIDNLKHKAIVFTAYSAGLRISEVVNLKLCDIDSGRMTLFISKAKGKKDRVVNLSPLLLDILRSYLKKEKNRLKNFYLKEL